MTDEREVKSKRKSAQESEERGIYEEDEGDSHTQSQTGHQGDYDFQIDEMERQGQEVGDEVVVMTAEEEKKAENELLFWIQGIGEIKKIGAESADVTVYVKKDGCEDCLKEIIKLVKYENHSLPFVR